MATLKNGGYIPYWVEPEPVVLSAAQSWRFGIGLIDHAATSDAVLEMEAEAAGGYVRFSWSDIFVAFVLVLEQIPTEVGTKEIQECRFLIK